MEIKERFITLRKHLGMNQKEMAAAIISSQAHISRIECGTESPTLQDKEILRLKFHLNLKWLDCGEGEMFIIEDMSRLDDYLVTRLRLLVAEVSFLLEERSKK